MACCVVSYLDVSGIRHTVELEAETLYEAAALAVRAFREHDCEPGALNLFGIRDHLKNANSNRSEPHFDSRWRIPRETPLPPLHFVGFTPDGSALVARRAEGMSSAIVPVDRSTGRVSVLKSGEILLSAIGLGASTHPTVIFTAESGSFAREVRVAKLEVRSSRLVGEKVIVRATGVANRMPFSYRVYRWQSPTGKLLEAKLYLPRLKAARPPPLVVVPYGGFTNSFDDPQGFLEQGLLNLIRRGGSSVAEYSLRAISKLLNSIVCARR